MAPDPELKLYAILRSDLIMSHGKACAQAGHAFLDSYLDACICAPDAAAAYAACKPGTKVTLEGCEQRLEMLYDKLRALGVPTARIIDSGHVEPPHFDGSDILTAIGVGPIHPRDAKPLLKRFKLWRGGLHASQAEKEV